LRAEFDRLFVIRIAPITAEEVDVARALIVEYGASLPVDLSFQNFADELFSLPGAYAPPGGALLLARVDGAAAGCVAFRQLDSAACEMKRLYVRPGFRGLQLGSLLVESAISAARERGFVEMRLDTLATMPAAHRLYERLGFREIPPYPASYAPGSRFYSLGLRDGSAGGH
jgi:putative acetyltransferase